MELSEEILDKELTMESEAQPRYRGRLVKWRGSWGFIRHDKRDIFVHLSNCVSGFTPELNAPVEFELTHASLEGKPPQANRVRLLRKDSAAGFEALRRGGLDQTAIDEELTKLQGGL